MKILVLTKRHHMGMDALAQNHGRYFRIPELLVREHQHQVDGLVADYHPAHTNTQYQSNTHVNWTVVPAAHFGVPRPDRLLKAAKQKAAALKPDIIWAGGDALICAVASHIARKHDTRYIIDLKDNYEAYTLTKLPGLRKMLYESIRKAHAVTCGSQELLDYALSCSAERPTLLPMAADNENFHPIPKHIARNHLGIPTDGFFIGTAGSLTKDRDITTLYDAAALLRTQHPNTKLLLAGHRARGLAPPANEYTYDFGHLSVTEVKWLFNALDLAIIANKPGTFGTYCYPQKLHEILACETPVIAAHTGPFTRSALPSGVIATYPPGSPDHLCEKARSFIANNKTPIYFEKETWKMRATTLNKLITEL